jgi:hypothetical protein
LSDFSASMSRSAHAPLLIGIVTFVAFLVLIEILVRVGVINQFAVAPPRPGLQPLRRRRPCCSIRCFW